MKISEILIGDAVPLILCLRSWLMKVQVQMIMKNKGECFLHIKKKRGREKGLGDHQPSRFFKGLDEREVRGPEAGRSLSKLESRTGNIKIVLIFIIASWNHVLICPFDRLGNWGTNTCPNSQASEVPSNPQVHILPQLPTAHLWKLFLTMVWSHFSCIISKGCLESSTLEGSAQR